MLALATTAPVMMPPVFPVQASPLTVERLASGREGEVLAFLAARPIHTVIMAGLIRDNGLVSQLNRGVFYACRNMMGRIEGVALIGHITMIETLNDSALQHFVELAQNNQRAHVVIGEVEKVARFWGLYAPSGQAMRLTSQSYSLGPNTVALSPRQRTESGRATVLSKGWIQASWLLRHDLSGKERMAKRQRPDTLKPDSLRSCKVSPTL